MAGKQYQLRWNTHTSTFVNLLDQFRTQELYCDASLACCGRVYPVHQVVLSACSEFFSNVFTQASASQQQPLVVVQGAGRDEVECLLEFMYTGQVTISRIHLPALLRVASSLQVKGLLEAQRLQQEEKGQQSEAGVEDEQLKAKGNDTQFKDNLQDRQFQDNGQLIVGMRPGQLETETGQSEGVECNMLKDEVASWETEGERMERLGEAASGLAKSPWSERQLTRMAPILCDSHPHDVNDIVSHDTQLHKTQPSDSLSYTIQTHDYDAQQRPSSAKSRRSPRPSSNRKSPCPAPGVRSPSPSLIPLTTHRGPFHSLCETKEEPPDDWVKQEKDDDEEEEAAMMIEERSWLQKNSDMKILLGHSPTTAAPSSSPHTLPTPALTSSSPMLTPTTSQLRRELLKPLPSFSPDLTCPTTYPLPSSSSLSLRTSPHSPSQPVSPHLHFSPSYHYPPLHTSSSTYPHPRSPCSSPNSPLSLPHPVITSAVERAYSKKIPPLMKIPSPSQPDVMPTQEPPLPQTTQFLTDDSCHTHSLSKDRPQPSIIHARLYVPPPTCPPTHPRPASHPFAQTGIHSSDSSNDAPLNLSRERRRGRDPLLGKIATKRKRRLRGPKCWEYLARLLNDPSTNPSLVRWENRSNGVFRLVQPAVVAQRWGRRAGKHANDALTYENFARGLRYHYATGALQPVSERSFVYRFGPKALRSLQENTPPALILDTTSLSSQQPETQSSSHSLPTVLASVSSLPTVVTTTYFPPTTLAPASHSQSVT